MNVWASVGLVVTLVILIIALGIGASIISEVQEIQCDYTWGTYSTSDSVDPISSGYVGCCQSVNASEATDCDTWSTSAALNVSYQGLEGAESFGNLTPVMWLVGAAAVILSLLIGGLAVRAFK